MICLLVGIILIFLMPFLWRGVHRDLVRSGFAGPTILAVIMSIVLLVIAGFIFLSKFRFVR
jgi:uncharacterized YccA/Bax inhibitor family protein